MATTLPWPVAAVVHIANHKAREMENAARNSGGWEGWLQVELQEYLAPHFAHGHVHREQNIYTDGRLRCDVTVHDSNSHWHLIELKTEVKSDINPDSGTSALRNRVHNEQHKFDGVKAGYRPSTGWVIGVGGQRPAGHGALHDVHEHWFTPTASHTDGFWGQVGVFWTRVSL